MASRLTNKWTVLLAVQKRLDQGRVGRYEAVLALYAVRSLFPGLHDDFMLPDPSNIWAMSIHNRLFSIVEDTDLPAPAPEEWIAAWEANRITDRAIAERASDELLGTTRTLEDLMPHTRYDLRGKIIVILERVPNVITPDALPEMNAILRDMVAVKEEFAANPLRFVDKDTRDELKRLDQLFGRLESLLSQLYQESMAAFRRGDREYNICPDFEKIRTSLATKSHGPSVAGGLAAKLAAKKERKKNQGK